MRRTGSGSGGYSPAELLDSIRRFGDLRVLVVGDLFLDEYIEGEMIEISKEGPMPVIRVDSRTRTPGAAGNLASSIRNLGAQVSVAGIVGADPNGKDLLSALRAKGIRADGVIIDERRPTLTYSKLRARVANSPSQEILRMDVLPGSRSRRRRRMRSSSASRRNRRESGRSSSSIRSTTSSPRASSGGR